MSSFSTNILILGKIGAGKASLVNYLYSQEIAVSRSLRPAAAKGLHYHKPFSYKDINIVIWDTWGLEADKAQEWWTDLRDSLVQQSGNPDIRDWIHTVIYCFDAKRSRLDEYEKEHILKPLADMGYRIIFALTKWGLCSPDEKEAARQVIFREFPGFSRISVESVSQKLRNGAVTRQQGRDSIFREICLNLRENLTYHLRKQIRVDMAAAVDQAEAASRTYFNENTSIFKAYSEELHESIQDVVRKNYREKIGAVYERLRSNLTLIDMMCVEVIRGYTGIDVSETLKNFYLLVESMNDIKVSLWDSDFDDYFVSSAMNTLFFGIYRFVQSNTYQKNLDNQLSEISAKLTQDLENIADTLDHAENKVAEDLSRLLAAGNAV